MPPRDSKSNDSLWQNIAGLTSPTGAEKKKKMGLRGKFKELLDKEEGPVPLCVADDFGFVADKAGHVEFDFVGLKEDFQYLMMHGVGGSDDSSVDVTPKTEGLGEREKASFRTPRFMTNFLEKRNKKIEQAKADVQEEEQVQVVPPVPAFDLVRALSVVTFGVPGDPVRQQETRNNGDTETRSEKIQVAPPVPAFDLVRALSVITFGVPDAERQQETRNNGDNETRFEKKKSGGLNAGMFQRHKPATKNENSKADLVPTKNMIRAVLGTDSGEDTEMRFEKKKSVGLKAGMFQMCKPTTKNASTGFDAESESIGSDTMSNVDSIDYKGLENIYEAGSTETEMNDRTCGIHKSMTELYTKSEEKRVQDRIQFSSSELCESSILSSVSNRYLETRKRLKTKKSLKSLKTKKSTVLVNQGVCSNESFEVIPLEVIPLEKKPSLARVVHNAITKRRQKNTLRAGEDINAGTIKIAPTTTNANEEAAVNTKRTARKLKSDNSVNSSRTSNSAASHSSVIFALRSLDGKLVKNRVTVNVGLKRRR